MPGIAEPRGRVPNQSSQGSQCRNIFLFERKRDFQGEITKVTLRSPAIKQNFGKGRRASPPDFAQGCFRGRVWGDWISAVGIDSASLRLRGTDEASVATWTAPKPDAGKLKPDFQSPKPMPMALAVRTTSPFGFTDFRWPMAWAMSTETTDSPRRATIMPKPPAEIRSTAATPKRVARMRSKGEGVPPR